MLRTFIGKIRAGLRACILLVTIASFMLSYLISLLFRKRTKATDFDLRRSWVSLASNVMGIKYTVTGKMHDKPSLYVSNHRSFSDPLVSTIFIDAFVIAKAEVAGYPFINKGAEMTGVLYVKRENKDSRSAARQALVDTILAGHNVLVYPEGTVSKTRKVIPYKHGTFKEAALNNIPVVPIALEYKNEVDMWPSGSFVKQFFRQFSKPNTYVKMTIGPVFENSDGNTLREQVENWTNEELARLQKGWSDAFDKA